MGNITYFKRIKGSEFFNTLISKCMKLIDGVNYTLETVKSRKTSFLVTDFYVNKDTGMNNCVSPGCNCHIYDRSMLTITSWEI